MKDRLLSMNAAKAQWSAFKLLDGLQRIPKHEQVAAASLMFLLICKRFKENPRDLLQLAEQFHADALREGQGDHVRAIQNYLKNEI